MGKGGGPPDSGELGGTTARYARRCIWLDHSGWVDATAVTIRDPLGVPAWHMAAQHPDTPVSRLIPPDRRGITDQEVAQGLASGEAWAVAEAWHRFAPMVLTAAERALGSKAEAQDVAQEVFCRLYRKAKTLRDPAALRSFVFSFGVRVLKSELRRKKARAWLSFHRPEVLVDLGAGTLDLDIEGRDVLRRFYALLDRLSAEDRLVFALRHLESMTVEEGAATMSLSVSTVKRRLNHGMQRFTRLLESDPELARLLEGKGWRGHEGGVSRAP